MGTTDLIGIIASFFTLSASAMRGMLALRAFNMTSNFGFIIYGVYLDTMPMIVLHSILLPLNTYHLCIRLKAKMDAEKLSDISVIKPIEENAAF